MEETVNSRRRRKTYCTSCTVLILTIVIVLMGFSLIGAAVYEEAQFQKYITIMGKDCLTWCYIFLSVGVSCLAFGVTALAVSCCQKTYFGAAVLTLLAIFSVICSALFFVKTPWMDTRILLRNANEKYGSDGYQDITEAWDKLEERLKCCTTLIKDYTAHCGPMREMWNQETILPCTQMVQNLAKTSRSPVLSVAICNNPCESEIYFSIKKSLFIIGFLGFAISLVQVCTVFMIWIAMASGCLHGHGSRFSQSNPLRCKLSCDLFGRMCACGFTCLDNERNSPDTIPITGQEHPPPYSPPTPSTANDLIDLADIDLLGDLESSTTDTNPVEQTRL